MYLAFHDSLKSSQAFSFNMKQHQKQSMEEAREFCYTKRKKGEVPTPRDTALKLPGVSMTLKKVNDPIILGKDPMNFRVLATPGGFFPPCCPLFVGSRAPVQVTATSCGPKPQMPAGGFWQSDPKETKAVHGASTKQREPPKCEGVKKYISKQSACVWMKVVIVLTVFATHGKREGPKLARIRKVIPKATTSGQFQGHEECLSLGIHQVCKSGSGERCSAPFPSSRTLDTACSLRSCHRSKEHPVHRHGADGMLR